MTVHLHLAGKITCLACGGPLTLGEWSTNDRRTISHITCRDCAATYALQVELHPLTSPRGFNRGDSHPLMDGEKWCPTCETVRPLDDFGANRARSDGHVGECRYCVNARHRRDKQKGAA